MSRETLAFGVEGKQVYKAYDDCRAQGVLYLIPKQAFSFEDVVIDYVLYLQRGVHVMEYFIPLWLLLSAASYMHQICLKLFLLSFILLSGRATKRGWMSVSSKKSLRSLVLHSFTPLSEHCGITILKSFLTDWHKRRIKFCLFSSSECDWYSDFIVVGKR